MKESLNSRDAQIVDVLLVKWLVMRRSFSSDLVFVFSGRRCYIHDGLLDNGSEVESANGLCRGRDSIRGLGDARGG